MKLGKLPGTALALGIEPSRKPTCDWQRVSKLRDRPFQNLRPRRIASAFGPGRRDLYTFTRGVPVKQSVRSGRWEAVFAGVSGRLGTRLPPPPSFVFLGLGGVFSPKSSFQRVYGQNLHYKGDTGAYMPFRRDLRGNFRQNLHSK